jgi:predicted amidohydrolase
MRIGTYQFTIANDLQKNLTHIKKAIEEASHKGVKLLILPECALTGYPNPESCPINEIDFKQVEFAFDEIGNLTTENDLYIVAGSAEYSEGKYYNSAFLAKPKQKPTLLYRKGALWGWDADNFSPGEDNGGVFEIDGIRIGVRICFEVRFPEYFRELYRENVDCAVVMFCDNSESDMPERYDLIKSHLKTRAVENVFPIVCANNCAESQTAPTAVFDQDGNVLLEAPRHIEQLLVYEFEKNTELSFGARGRKVISNLLVK